MSHPLGEAFRTQLKHKDAVPPQHPMFLITISQSRSQGKGLQA